jgi:hypothetical protein
VRIEGPQDLLSALRENLGRSGNIIWVPGSGRDVHVEIANTVIETRLEAWAAHLREAMR